MRSFTSVQVEEDAHASVGVVVVIGVVGVNTLHPAVEYLVEVIEVVLSVALVVAARAGCVVVSHAFEPAVVCANGLKEVAIKPIKCAAEVFCTSVNVVICVLASI